MVTPTNDTTTGCDDLLSGSGGVIKIVKTDPKLVPTHNVGVKIDGSVKQMRHLRNSYWNTQRVLLS